MELNRGNPVLRRLIINALLELEARANSAFPFHERDLTADEMAYIREYRNRPESSYDPDLPLLTISVRSGAPFSMPGMMDTVINVPFTDELSRQLIKQGQDPKFVWDSYRRFLSSYASAHHGLDAKVLSEIMNQLKEKYGHDQAALFSADELEQAARAYEEKIKLEHPEHDTTNAFLQVVDSVIDVYLSWNGKIAVDFRNDNGVSHALNTGVVLQQMVYGNKKDGWTGVIEAKRNEIDGAAKHNSQGPDVVDGMVGQYYTIKQTEKKDSLEEFYPTLHVALSQIVERLRVHEIHDLDIEFTLDPDLYTGDPDDLYTVEYYLEIIRILQVRTMPMNGKRDQVRYNLSGWHVVPLSTGIPASPNASLGRIVNAKNKNLNELRAEVADLRQQMNQDGEEDLDIILVFDYITPNDSAKTRLPGVGGLISQQLGKSTHAAMIAMGEGYAFVSDLSGLEFGTDDKSDDVIIRGNVIREGTDGPIVLIDGHERGFERGHSPTGGDVFIFTTEQAPEVLKTKEVIRKKSGARLSGYEELKRNVLIQLQFFDVLARGSQNPFDEYAISNDELFSGVSAKNLSKIAAVITDEINLADKYILGLSHDLNLENVRASIKHLTRQTVAYRMLNQIYAKYLPAAGADGPKTSELEKLADQYELALSETNIKIADLMILNEKLNKSDDGIMHQIDRWKSNPDRKYENLSVTEKLAVPARSMWFVGAAQDLRYVFWAVPLGPMINASVLIDEKPSFELVLEPKHSPRGEAKALEFQFIDHEGVEFELLRITDMKDMIRIIQEPENPYRLILKAAADALAFDLNDVDQGNRDLKRMLASQANGYSVRLTEKANIPTRQGLGGSHIAYSAILRLMIQRFAHISIQGNTRNLMELAFMTQAGELDLLRRSNGAQRGGGGTQDGPAGQSGGFHILTQKGLQPAEFTSVTRNTHNAEHTRAMLEILNESVLYHSVGSSHESSDTLTNLQNRILDRDDDFLRLAWESIARAETGEKLLVGVTAVDSNPKNESSVQNSANEFMKLSAKDIFYFREMHQNKNPKIDSLYFNEELQSILGSIDVDVFENGNRGIKKIAPIRPEGAEGTAVAFMITAQNEKERDAKRKKLKAWMKRYFKNTPDTQMMIPQIAYKGAVISETSDGARFAQRETDGDVEIRDEATEEFEHMKTGDTIRVKAQHLSNGKTQLIIERGVTRQIERDVTKRVFLFRKVTQKQSSSETHFKRVLGTTLVDKDEILHDADISELAAAFSADMKAHLNAFELETTNQLEHRISSVTLNFINHHPNKPAGGRLAIARALVLEVFGEFRNTNENSFNQFVQGVDRAFSNETFSDGELSFEVAENIPYILQFKKLHNQTIEVYVNVLGELIPVHAIDVSRQTRAENQTALSGRVLLSDLMQAYQSLELVVNRHLDAVVVDRALPQVHHFPLELLGRSITADRADLLILQAVNLRKVFPNVIYLIDGDDDAKRFVMNRIQVLRSDFPEIAGKLNSVLYQADDELPESHQDAEHVYFTPEGQALFGEKSIPMRPLQEGDVFYSLAASRLAAVAGAIIGTDVPEGLQRAWSALSGENPTLNVIRALLNGSATPDETIQFSIKPTLKAALNAAARLSRMIRQWVATSA
jgi:hypothetical protein